MTTSREIVFVDQNVSDLHSLLAGLRPDVEPIVLTASERATAQIATALKGRDDLHAIHIVAHGSAGEVRFGAGTLSRETLDDHAADLAEIGRALGRDGQLSLWSCETGQGKRGAAFVEALERATGADVAATAGLVGSAARGGRWELDSGFAQAPLTLEGMAAYAGVMSTHLKSFSLTAITTDAGAADFLTNDHTLILNGSLKYNGSDGTNQVTSFELWLSGGEFGVSTLIGTFSFPPGFLPGDPSRTSTIDWSFNLATLGIAAAQFLNDGTYTLLLKEPGGGGGPLPVTAGGNAQFIINSNLDVDPPTQTVVISTITDDVAPSPARSPTTAPPTTPPRHWPARCRPFCSRTRCCRSSATASRPVRVPPSPAPGASPTRPPHGHELHLPGAGHGRRQQCRPTPTARPSPSTPRRRRRRWTSPRSPTTPARRLHHQRHHADGVGHQRRARRRREGAGQQRRRRHLVRRHAGAATHLELHRPRHPRHELHLPGAGDRRRRQRRQQRQPVVTIDTTAPTAALDITAITDDTGTAATSPPATPR